MKTSLMLVLLLLFVVGCTGQSVPSTPTLSGATIVAPSATPTETLLPTKTTAPTATPEPTAVPEKFSLNDGKLQQWNDKSGVYELVLNGDGEPIEAAQILTDPETGWGTALNADNVPVAVFLPETGEVLKVDEHGRVQFEDKLYAWDGQSWAETFIQPEEILAEHAAFTRNVEWASTDEKLVVNISDAVLDFYQAKNITVEPALMDQVFKHIIKDVYQRAGQPEGSELTFVGMRKVGFQVVPERTIKSKLTSIENFVVTPAEFNEMLSDHKFADPEKHLVYRFYGNGASEPLAIVWFEPDGSLRVITKVFYGGKISATEWDLNKQKTELLRGSLGFVKHALDKLVSYYDLKNEDELYTLMGCDGSNCSRAKVNIER